MNWFIVGWCILSVIINVAGICMIANTLDSLVSRRQDQDDQEPLEFEGNYEVKILPNGMYGLFENNICVKRASTSFGIRNEMDDYFKVKRHLAKKLK